MIISIYRESWIIILQIFWNFSSYLFYFSYWEEGLIVFTKDIWKKHLKKWNREKYKKHKENYRKSGKSGKSGEVKRKYLRDLALRTIFTQQPWQVMRGGWSFGSAV